MPRVTRSVGACLLVAAGLFGCGGGGPGTLDDDPFASPRPGGGAGQPASIAPIGGGGVPGRGGGVPVGGGGGVPIGGDGLPNAGGATGAPDWVRVGLRMTWYVAAASVPQSRFAWVEDPNGNWEDPKTGKRYTRTDEGGGTGQPGASGDGLSQVDVVAIEGGDVVLDSNIYTINRTTTPPTLGWIIGPGARVPGATVDGAWMHPALLARYAQQPLDGLLVLRGLYTVGGRTYTATAFATTTAGAYQSYTYDSESGVLLSASTNTAGATSPLRAPGEAPPRGNSQLTYTQFLGMRQRAVPGLGGPAPGWVAGTATLRYGGVYTITNPARPGQRQLQLPGAIHRCARAWRRDLGAVRGARLRGGHRRATRRGQCQQLGRLVLVRPGRAGGDDDGPGPGRGPLDRPGGRGGSRGRRRRRQPRRHRDAHARRVQPGKL